MTKYTRNYPHTNDWKARTYKQQFRKVNIALLVGLAILLILQLNAIL